MTGWLMVAPPVLGVALLWPADVASAGEAAGDPAQGEALFQANCAMCHGNDATGMMGMHPALRGAVDRVTVEGVEVTIRNGRDTRPPMPAFGDRLNDAISPTSSHTWRRCRRDRGISAPTAPTGEAEKEAWAA